ncbi:magnesium transporter [Aliiglaciecola sp. 3_MG-2023]|uniref:magnesium transporter n=1 Tax=Aliiglaciecola sp. 3_MG-2023 TaxID=3062644 RepID=UPI0026E38FFF|nr:magnesium transporter [Aliiglaciecola sp. 3_MG-2023]MDO6692304.1 magnesium transporter [Aliiglaciecola sp. 3_MG-2023]
MAEQISDLIHEAVNLDDDADSELLHSKIAVQDEADIALLLESLPLEQRLSAWHALPRHKQIDVLVEMRGDPRETLLEATPYEELEDLFTDVDAESLLELSDSLHSRLLDLALEAMDKKQRQLYEGANQYPEEQIGHWRNSENLILPLSAKVSDAKRFLRREVPDYADCIYLVNRAGQYSEAVKLFKIYSTPEHTPLADIAEDDITIVKANDDCNSAALSVQRSGYTSLPLVDENFKFLGRVDIGAACELLNESYERQLMASAGMDEDEDLFSSVQKSAKNRALWLGINLLTAFLASWFIGLFEATLQQVVALAVLMPVVASMGGIAGSQTLTLIIRGLALKQVNAANLKALLIKELKVGGLNGVIWAIVIASVASYWFSSAMLGLVIGCAILVNICVAALAGVGVPVLLDKLKLDPALSGSVILTTVTDIVGFVSFLGLGALFLL